ERDHDELLSFLNEVELDWAGFFSYSREDGTYAAGLDGAVPTELVEERLLELHQLQDESTGARRRGLIGCKVEVLVDAPGIGRTHREAPEIDGVVLVPAGLATGSFADVVITGVAGVDLEASAAAEVA
ncbi:MAG TPA: 30S ribosomal protein S12 methylthiotransferase RimO, partial [Acidimicrobiales bacterium]|nr:30S ribosomal protein S12 methylthiotransferase RimO [Acidimicrobiales bacterium]